MAEPTGWPHVTVVVVNLNGKRHLGPCFESLLGLDYPADRLELILVDNGSRDGSVLYVRDRFSQVCIIQNEHNEGFARANNQGAAVANGDFVAFINNDMRADPWWLKELVTAAQSAGDVAVVGGKILTWDGSEVDFDTGVLNFHGMGFQPRDGTGPSKPSPVLFVCGGSMLVKRDLFLDAGGFDEDFFAYFEDVDLGWRLWVLGYRVLYTPHALTYHRGHATSARMAMGQLGVLYERNSLYSAIKNYGDEHQRQVLPAALLLLIRRAMIFGRIDKRHFRMPRSNASGPLPYQGQPDPVNGAGTPAAQSQSLVQRWRAFADEFGFWQGAKMTLRLVALLGYRLFGLQRTGMLLVSNHALSHLVAADDLIDALPSLMEKRAQIQSRRQRRDAEILPLFRDPFHPHPPLPEYAAVQHMLAQVFEIDHMFPEKDS